MLPKTPLPAGPHPAADTAPYTRPRQRPAAPARHGPVLRASPVDGDRP